MVETATQGVPAPAEIEACRRAVYAFFDYLDQGRFFEVASLMADDGVWMRQGKRLEGPAAVEAALRDRSATVVTTHVVTNLLLLPASEHEIEARYVLTVYAHDEGQHLDGPAPLAGPALVRRGTDTLTLEGDRWLVLHKQSEPVFQRPQPG